MTDPAIALSVTDLYVDYGRRPVLRGLNLVIPAGRINGLLGANGAGKTTLVRAICGRIRPRSGTIVIGGDQGVAGRRHIGLVPQEIALYPHLTVRENLEVFGRLSGLPQAAVRTNVPWVTEAASLSGHLDDQVHILSGGWKRRVNIAAAILHRPDLMILDEPTVGVDIEARIELQNLIRQLSQAGMAILLTTHDLDQAETLCDTVGFLRNGVVAPQGRPRDLVQALFQTQKEITIELHQPASREQAQVLTGAGFQTGQGGLLWSCLSAEAALSPASVAAPLEAGGIAVREVRFRDPGLQTLMSHHLRDSGAARPVSA